MSVEKRKDISKYNRNRNRKCIKKKINQNMDMSKIRIIESFLSFLRNEFRKKKLLRKFKRSGEHEKGIKIY